MTVFFMPRSLIPVIKGQEQTSVEIIKSLIMAFIAGVVTGILFGWIADKFFVGSMFTKPPKIDLDEAGNIHVQAAANYCDGSEALGGFLCLPDKWLIFKSLDLNNRRQELLIHLRDITHLNRYKNLYILKNRIQMQIG